MIVISRKTLDLLLLTAVSLLLAFGFSGCEEKGTDLPKEEPEEDVYEDIEVVDGKVRFYLSEEAGSAREKMGTPERRWLSSTVTVNGVKYKISFDEKSRPYVDVSADPGSTYNANIVTSESGKWYDESVYSDVRIPYSQFYEKTAADLASYPMYGSYRKETGNKMVFKDAFAVLDIALTGSEKISSVKVSAGEDPVAGLAVFFPTDGCFKLKEGTGFAVLNCTDNGQYVALDESVAAHFYIMMAPGNYKELDITISDSGHREMVHTIENANLSAEEITTVTLAYSPDDDLLFCERFDNFVWGGDIMLGQEGTGYAPTADRILIDTATDRTGYEDSFQEVPFDNPGSAFIQSNVWDEVSGMTVATSHLMSESYVASRNIGDYSYMFRCQEYQGYIACGAGNSGRGILQTGSLSRIDGFCGITVKFDFCYQYGSTDLLEFMVVNGGTIESVKINGNDVSMTADNSSYIGASGKFIIEKDKVILPSGNDAVKEWQHAEISVKNATDGTMLNWEGCDAGNGVHGFYIDNIEVRQTGKAEQSGNLRVLYWNIQNGMWADQADNYENFVAWVKRYDPDVCIWCESATIYKDNTSSGEAESNRFLPNGWASLAARYGHSYSAVGGWRDNFPQTVTSKYPIETILKITDTDESGKPVSHGAAIQQVNVRGQIINLVTLHTWPQAYSFGVTGAAEQEQSAANNGGDRYREFEIMYICEKTVNDPAYASCKDWIMAGDFNSRSRLDNWYYGYPDGDTRLLVHNHILDNTDLKDVIAERYPGQFISTTGGNARIDYVYTSPSMYDRITNSMVLMDKWTTIKQSPYVSSFRDPSDHRPILVDFQLEK